MAHQSFFFYDTMALTLSQPSLLRLAALCGVLLRRFKQQPETWKPAMDDLQEALANGEIAGIEQFWQRWRECDGDEETARALLDELEKSWGFWECAK